ncbi:MAG: hypothetical protein M5R36_12610 [Deltaproteobacteria bacterium]|nr:hypothetical protein [Deltaproteobacteria bacterium]
MTWYYVYRSQTSMQYAGAGNRLIPIIMVEDASTNLTGEINIFKAFASPQKSSMLVYRAAQITDKTKIDWNFEEERGDETSAWTLVTGASADLRPDISSFASSNYALPANPESFFPEPVYEYMVAGVTADISGNPVNTSDQPWSFGASCVEEGRFECPCNVDVTAEITDYCALHGDVAVSWNWVDGNVPPDGSRVWLVAKDVQNLTNPWEVVDLVIDPTGGRIPTTAASAADPARAFIPTARREGSNRSARARRIFTRFRWSAPTARGLI